MGRVKSMIGEQNIMTITNTTISDLVPNEQVLGVLVEALLPTKNPLIASGVATRAEVVDRAANGGARKVSIPFLNKLDSSAYNRASDDITVEGNVGKLTADEFSALRHDLNYGFGTADLVQMVTKYDAATGITQGFAEYWAGVFQRIAAKSLLGVKASQTSSINGTSVLYGTGATVSTAIGLDLLIDATAAVGGVYADQYDTLIITPVTKAKLQKANSTAYIPKGQTDIGFDVWAGFKIIVDKDLASNSSSVLARSGALAFGTGRPDGMVPFEIERKANGGNGQGGNILHTRQSVVIHPQGFNYKGGINPTEAATAGNLAHSGSWELAVPVEMAGIIFVRHDEA